jgi:hypothetical protein
MYNEITNTFIMKDRLFYALSDFIGEQKLNRVLIITIKMSYRTFN